MTFLSRELPGTGGRLRARPEHFLVEEVGLRPPSGRGDFLRVWIEKRRVSTPELVRRLAAALGCRPREIGVAGNKDSDAVARQWVSLPRAAGARLRSFHCAGVRVLDVVPDDAPLRTGDLLGNRFEVTISGLPDARAAARRAEAICELLVRRGVPSFFGPQRFGTRGNAPAIGRLLLQGDFEGAADELFCGGAGVETDPRALHFRELCRAGAWEDALEAAPPALFLERVLLKDRVAGRTARDAWHAAPLPDRRILLTAWQALAFNRALAERLDRLDVPLLGDLLVADLSGIGGRAEPRRCEDPEADRRAVERGVVHPTAPLFGSRVALADGEPGAIERRVLAGERVAESALDSPLGLSLPGERRAVRYFARDVAVDAEPAEGELTLRFALPRGCFATALLAEIMRDEPPPGTSPAVAGPSAHE